MINFYKRQTGIHLITWQGVLALAVFPSVFSARFPIENLKVDPTFLVLWLLGAQLVIGSALLLTRKIFFKDPTKTGIWRVQIATIMLAGFIFVFTVRTAIALNTGVAPNLDNLIHLFVMALGYCFWMLLIGVAASNTEKFRQSFGQLQAKISERRAVEFEQAIRLDALRSEVATELVASLKALLDEETISSSEAKLKVKLFDINEKILRPLARALSSRPLTQTNLLSEKLFKPDQKVTALTALRRTGEVGPFDFAFAPLLTAIISYFSKSWLLPAHMAFLSVLVSFTTLTTLFYLASLAHSRYRSLVPKGPRSWLVAAVFALIVATDMVLFRMLFGEHNQVKSLSILIAEIVAIFSAGIIRGTILERDLILRELESQAQKLSWAIARTGQLIWVEHQRLSKLLHGDIQAKIVSTAAALGAEEIKNEKRFEQLIDESLLALNSPLQRQSLRNLVADLAELWSASMRVSLLMNAECEHRLREDQEAEAAIEEIIRESLTNAAKHGGATKVSIDISLNEAIENIVVLEISNDGSPLADAVAPGQGSKLLDQVSMSWSRTSSGDGTALRVLIPTK